MLKIGGVVKFRYFCIVILFFIFLITSFTFPEKIEPFKGKSYVVPYVKKPPIIDGRITEEEWGAALKINKFYQSSPGYNIPPTAKTTFYIMYDRKNIYVAFKCSLKNVDKFIKVHARRDEPAYTEYVDIIFDTFKEYKNGYLIGFDPYGEIMDGITYVSSGFDPSQDFNIQSKGKIYPDRYEVEAKIPFNNFKFKTKLPIKWGFIVERDLHLKKGDEDDLNIKTDRNNSNPFEYEDYLIFNHSPVTRSAYFIPEFVGSYNREEFESSYSSPWENANYKGSVGGTFFLRPDSQTRMGVAVNPDFSEVEADDIKFDVNHRFPIYYEEKRPFFLESAENFSTPLAILFHSRNIIDPDFCLKFVRKSGNSTIASLYALERNQPGDRFGFYDTIGNINWYLFRYKYSLKGDSYLGLYSLNRKFKGSQNNVFSFDGRYKFKKRHTLSFMGLYSRYNDSPEFNNKTINGGGWDLKYDFTSRYFNYSFETYGVSDGFYDDAGFFRRNDYWFYSNDFNFHYEPESDKTLVRNASSDYYHLVGYDFNGNLTDRNDTLTFYSILRGGHLFTFSYDRYYELYLENGYRYTNYYFSYWNSHFKKFHFGVSYQWGEGVYYDSYFPQKGSYYYINSGINLYPTSKIYLSLTSFFSRMHNITDTKKLYGYFGWETEFKYQYTKNNYTRLLYEYTHYNYPLYDYSANNHFIQIVHTYNPRAYTALYFGFLYGRDHNLYHPYDWDYNRNYKVFVKIDYMFDVDF